MYIHLSRECGPHRDELKSLLASRAAMSQGPSKSLAASQVLLHCTVLLLGFFFKRPFSDLIITFCWSTSQLKKLPVWVVPTLQNKPLLHSAWRESFGSLPEMRRWLQVLMQVMPRSSFFKKSQQSDKAKSIKGEQNRAINSLFQLSNFDVGQRKPS